MNKDKEGEWYKAAHVVGDKSGIVMDILTNEPGIQFYSGNFMNEQVQLKNGEKDAFRQLSVSNHSIFQMHQINPSFQRQL